MKKKIIIFLIIILSISCLTRNTFSHSSGCISTKEDPFCLKNINEELKPVSNNMKLEDLIFNIIKYLLGFLGLISVIYGIYGGFQILTASSDDDKVQNGKKIIMRACLGLFIIFLAYPITRFIVKDFLFGEETIKDYSKEP